jgi:Fe-S oxidoreductase
VLLFNSIVKLFGHGKLPSKWKGPYNIVSASSHGVVTLQNDEGMLFKVNGHRLKVFHDTQLLEEELDIINLKEFK